MSAQSWLHASLQSRNRRSRNDMFPNLFTTSLTEVHHPCKDGSYCPTENLSDAQLRDKTQECLIDFNICTSCSLPRDNASRAQLAFSSATTAKNSLFFISPPVIAQPSDRTLETAYRPALLDYRRFCLVSHSGEIHALELLRCTLCIFLSRPSSNLPFPSTCSVSLVWLPFSKLSLQAPTALSRPTLEVVRSCMTATTSHRIDWSAPLHPSLSKLQTRIFHDLWFSLVFLPSAAVLVCISTLFHPPLVQRKYAVCRFVV